MFNKYFNNRFFKISFLIFVFSFFINTNITKANTYYSFFNVPGNNAPNSSYIIWLDNNLPTNIVLGQTIWNTLRYAGNYVPTGFYDFSPAPTTWTNSNNSISIGSLSNTVTSQYSYFYASVVPSSNPITNNLTCTISNTSRSSIYGGLYLCSWNDSCLGNNSNTTSANSCNYPSTYSTTQTSYIIPTGLATTSINIIQSTCGNLTTNNSGDGGLQAGATIFNGCFSTTTSHILHRASATLPTTNTAPNLYVR